MLPKEASRPKDNGPSFPWMFNLSPRCRGKKVCVDSETGWLLGMELGHPLQPSCCWIGFAFPTGRFLDWSLRLNTARYSIFPNSAPHSIFSNPERVLYEERESKGGIPKESHRQGHGQCCSYHIGRGRGKKGGRAWFKKKVWYISSLGLL